MRIASNKKAKFNYTILETFVAGIQLFGYEVKAIREKNVSFEGSYVTIKNDEPFVINLHIGNYSKQSQDSEKTDAKRPRKLLMNKREIAVLKRELSQKGKSVVPLTLLLKNNLIKLEIGVVAGKKKYEKKIVAKERQIKKDLDKFSKQII